MNVHIIRTDGSEEDIQTSFGDIHTLIGAQTFDTVNLRDGCIMIVDDAGYETDCVEHTPGHFELRPIKARKPVNWTATELYWSVCVPGVTHKIVGDVAIVVDDEVNS